MFFIFSNIFFGAPLIESLGSWELRTFGFGALGAGLPRSPTRGKKDDLCYEFRVQDFFYVFLLKLLVFGPPWAMVHRGPIPA